MNYEKLFKYMSEEHGITFLESDMQEICNIVNETQGDEWQDTIDWEIATKSYEQGQKDLEQKEKSRDLLIDFCSEINCNKTRKEMLKKIQPFLKNRI